MSDMFSKDLVRAGCLHFLTKASILRDLKHFQHVKESWNLFNRHDWYTVCTTKQEQIERQVSRDPMGGIQTSRPVKHGLRFFF